LVGCSPALPANTPAQAWIDAPRDGMQMPMQPYNLVFHGSDQAGVRQMEISVDGAVLDTLANPDTTALLVHMSYTWNPRTAGRHVISVRTQNIPGAWSQPAAVTVEVESPTATASLTPTRTARPTHTPTQPATPTLTVTPTPSISFGSPTLSSPGLYYGGGTCKPNQVHIQINVGPAVDIKAVLFIHKLTDTSTNQTTDWSTGQAMQAKGNGVYAITLNGEAFDLKAGFNHSQVSYRFIAQLANGGESRSQVFSDLNLAICFMTNGN
jgi:hypothetical protein